jgi:hypothetical protein
MKPVSIRLSAHGSEMDEAAPRRGAKRIRVFLGPVEIAGHYAGLEAAFREIGVDALAVDLRGHPYQYRRGSPPDPLIVRLTRWARVHRRRSGASRLRRAAWAIPVIATTLLLVGWAARRFDAFIFGFGETPLLLRELPLLRLLGKRIVFVFHGSDARPPYIDGARMAPDRALPIAECIALTRRTKAAIGRIERLADVVVAQPAFSHLFERPIVNFFRMGVLWRHRTAQPAALRADRAALRILHSPSDPTVKGSARIREAVEGLTAEGLPLELIELRDVPNDLVRDELDACAFAVDQIYSDAPMVGFATEAAVAGKPSIVGGYAWPENYRLFGAAAMPPVEECTPEGLSDAIRRLSTDPARRIELGLEAQAWVLEHWSPRAVATRYLALLEGPPPADWMFDPRDVRYVEGCGLSRDDARALVRAVIEAGGPEALCVADKPDLEAAFVAFASQES